jgi:hypothetical protein
MASSEDHVPDLIAALQGVPDRLAKQALDEILRLRERVTEPMPEEKQAEVLLTADEREAIYRAEARLRTAYVPDDDTAATLRALLERTK